MADMFFHLVVGVAVCDEEIDVPVVVVIEEFDAPTAHEPRKAANSHGARHVVERIVMTIAVDGIHFLIDVGNKEILPAILVKVCGVNAHAGPRAPLLAVSYARCEPDFLKLSVTTIHKKKVWLRVVGHKKVYPPIVVDVRCNDT